MTSDPLAPNAPAQAGIEGFPGPFPVGRYAAALRDKMREFAGVCVIGEATGVRFGRGPNVYFELRDADGALPCAMWRDDFERSGLSEADFRDGAEVVAGGGCDFYVGGPAASPRFTFRVKQLRLAGEGDLLARLERLRRRLAEEGLFERQKLLPRRSLPRRIGVVTAETGAARRDFLAGLERRGWRGTIVWGYAPVQDRRAAGAITTAIQDLAAVGEVETIVVTRGGGSIADLWAFCDETLCRTVALLSVPVISAVGHHVDRTLIDDVAAVSCSTPTHAAEAAVEVDCDAAREWLARSAERLRSRSAAGLLQRARALAAYSRAPRERVAAQKRELHQNAKELRAASRRGLAARVDYHARIASVVLARKRDAASLAVASGRASVNARAAALARASEALERRRREALAAHAAAIRAHDPERTLERGYAIALGPDGQPLAGAAAVREVQEFELRMADGSVPARVREEVER